MWRFMLSAVVALTQLWHWTADVCELSRYTSVYLLGFSKFLCMFVSDHMATQNCPSKDQKHFLILIFHFIRCWGQVFGLGPKLFPNVLFSCVFCIICLLQHPQVSKVWGHDSWEESKCWVSSSFQPLCVISQFLSYRAHGATNEHD